MKAWHIASGLAILSCVIAAVFFRNVDSQVTSSLLTSLRSISPVVFAVLGIWVSALDPGAILDGESDHNSERSRLAQRLLPLVKLALIVFLIAITYSYVLSLLSQAVTESRLFNALAGAVLTWAYLLLVYVLLMTLGPVETLRAKMREKQLQKDSSEDSAK